jgi:small subunit ribosomal protein S7
MSRKNSKNLKRYIAPDSKYSSVKVSKFINRLMMDGKKRIAENIVYAALARLAKESGVSVVEAFEKALANAMPLMEVKSRRVGGSTYQVPIEVRSDRALALAMRWLIANSRTRSGRTMIDRLSNELIDAYNNTGITIKKREDTHKMAEANKAFAHFRW